MNDESTRLLRELVETVRESNATRRGVSEDFQTYSQSYRDLREESRARLQELTGQQEQQRLEDVKFRAELLSAMGDLSGTLRELLNELRVAENRRDSST